jgi:hypothetical protein
LGDFDKQGFMNDLKRVVETASGIICKIPYKHYTFIAIGPGGGGIEHLNSTSIAFSGTGLTSDAAKRRMYSFLAHEYFHHYNVKRIRPIELGPFDYDKGSRTKMLWVSEGLSVYYEYLIVKRAGISTDAELFNAFRGNMISFENKPGRFYQTLEQASYETWSDGPFGRTGDEVNKTISYYDKGPAVGLLFDFKIRQLTKDQKSLDDVMRFLYKEYYQKKKRGFTEEELRKAFETIAGSSLAEEFEYVTTTKELDYPRYFNREDVFAIRTLFWWGNFFSITLHIAGSYKEKYETKIIDSFGSLQKENFSLCINEDQWEHHFEADNFISVGNTNVHTALEWVRQKKFLKIARRLSFEQWDSASSFFTETNKEMLDLFHSNHKKKGQYVENAL